MTRIQQRTESPGPGRGGGIAGVAVIARRPDAPPRWFLPRGRVDFARQVAIWFGFVFAYQIVRGLTSRDAATALANARAVVDLERHVRLAIELRLQHSLLHLGTLVTAVNWTYWLSQFVVVGLVFLWVYLRRNESFLLLRDTLIVTNALGLVVYVLLPTAPPRLLPGSGLVDTLMQSHTLNHGSGIVELAENPFAAMPSIHTADALIVGVALAALVRPLWLRILCACWPVWVGFSLIASGNHYWLDIAAGVLLVAMVAPLVASVERRLGRAPTAAGRS